MVRMWVDRSTFRPVEDPGVEALNPGIAALRGEIDATSALTGQSSASIRALAKSLQDAKVSAADMPAALRAAAMAEAALGQGGAQEFIASIREGKTAVSKLAAETQAKLGGVVARQMLGLEAQSNRFRSNIASLFGGLNIDPVLGGMQTLVALFDKTEASGRAIEFLFGKVFQPLIDQAQNAAYVVEAFALGFLIGLTKIYIAAKPVIAAVSELFGFDDTSLADVLNLAKNAGELFAKAFVVAAAILTGVITLFGAITAVAMAFEGAIFAVIAAVATLSAKLLGALGEALTAVRSYFASINWSEIGTNIMLGIARGIEYGWVHHYPHALKAGVTEEELRQLKAGTLASSLSVPERAAIEYGQAFANLGNVPDSTFAALKANFSERQITDITLIAAYFVALGSIMNALQVELEAPATLAQRREREG